MKKAKVLQQLHTSQLFKQYFKRILLFFSIPCLLFSVVLYSSYKIHNDNISQKSFSSTVDYSVRSLNNIFNEIHKKFYLINSDKTVRNTMFLNADSFFLPENYAAIASMNSILTYCLDTSNFIDSIYLYSVNSDYVYTVDKTFCVSSSYFDSFVDNDWYDAYEQSPSPQIIIGQYNENYKSDVISVIYQTYIGDVNTGFLVFNVTANTLRDSLFPENNVQNTNILIKSGDNEIFSTFSDDTDTRKRTNALQHSERLDFPNITLTVSSVPNERNIFSPILLVFFIVVLSIIIPVFMSLALSNSFYTSISKISSSLLNLFPLETAIENEMEFIEDNIKKMIHTSQSLEHTVAHYLHETQQAQLISLQTQLNPHFLFNTLNALSLMNATDSSKDDFEILVRDLSNILSYCLNTTNNLVTIHNEIEYSSYYLEMEGIKYHAAINAKIDIPESLRDNYVPKFIFQPILENALKHGFKYNFNKQNKITIQAKTENDALLIEFYNNGNGISERDSDVINARLADGYFPQNQHIGLYNVNKRIQLFYEKNFGCKIHPAADGGTTVIIKIPSKHSK